MQVNISIYFNGNCEEAMNFYKDAMDGEIVSIMRYGDAPMPCSDAQKNKVMHGRLKAGDTQMFFSDSSEQHKTVAGDNFAVSLSFTSEDSINKTFAAVSAGGKVIMDLQDTFWGARFGMCCDKFGINWMFNFDKVKQ